MKRNGWAWVGFGALFMLGCASSSRTHGVGNSLLSDNNEAQLGAELSKKVEAEMGLVDDPALLTYVQAVGARVAKESSRQDVTYTFQIVNSPEPNAFALPGGYRYVSRGILALCNSEDELAGVLGHEIGHVAAKHASQTLTRAVIMSPVTIATAIAGSITGIIAPRVGDFIEGVGQTTTGIVLSPHSRTQEREADRLGQEMMAKAGYDPVALPRVLDSLQRENTLDNPSDESPNRFLTTHPTTSERVEQTGERAQKLSFTARPGIAPDQTAFLNKLKDLRIGDDIRKGVFVKSQYIDPDEGFTMEFPESWKTDRKKGIVLAQPAKGDALLLLQNVGKLEGLTQLMKERSRKIRAKNGPAQTVINGFDAWEVEGTMSSSSNGFRVRVVWIKNANTIYEITSAAPPKQFSSYDADFSHAIGSYRSLLPSDLQRVREPRLVIVQAKERRPLLEIAMQDPDIAWSSEQIAVFNGLKPDSIVQPGQQLKIAIRQPLLTTPAR